MGDARIQWQKTCIPQNSISNYSSEKKYCLNAVQTSMVISKRQHKCNLHYNVEHKNIPFGISMMTPSHIYHLLLIPIMDACATDTPVLLIMNRCANGLIW